MPNGQVPVLEWKGQLLPEVCSCAKYILKKPLNDIKVNLLHSAAFHVLFFCLFVCFGCGSLDAIFCSSRVSRSLVFWPVVTTWPAQTIGNGPKSMQWTITSVAHSMVKTDYIEIAAIRDENAQQLLIDFCFFIFCPFLGTQSNQMWDRFSLLAKTKRKRKKRSIISSRIPLNRSSKV